MSHFRGLPLPNSGDRLNAAKEDVGSVYDVPFSSNERKQSNAEWSDVTRVMRTNYYGQPGVASFEQRPQVPTGRYYATAVKKRGGRAGATLSS